VDILSTPEKIAKCLPYLVSWSTGDRAVKATFRVDVGGVVDYLSRLKADVEIRVMESSTDSVVYSFSGRVARAQYGGTIRVRVSPAGQGSSRVEWEADVELGKVLKLLGFFVDVDELVEKIVGDVVKSISSCAREGGRGESPGA